MLMKSAMPEVYTAVLLADFPLIRIDHILQRYIGIASCRHLMLELACPGQQCHVHTMPCFIAVQARVMSSIGYGRAELMAPR